MKFLAVLLFGKPAENIFEDKLKKNCFRSVLLATLGFVHSDEKCEDIMCPYNYTPVCARPLGGGKAATFGNDCGVHAYECQTKTSAYVE